MYWKGFHFNSFSLMNIWDLLLCTHLSCYFTKKETEVYVCSLIGFSSPKDLRLCLRTVICSCRKGWGKSMQTASMAQQVLGLNLVLYFGAPGGTLTLTSSSFVRPQSASLCPCSRTWQSLGLCSYYIRWRESGKKCKANWLFFHDGELVPRTDNECAWCSALRGAKSCEVVQ